jgi:hypothetical protein
MVLQLKPNLAQVDNTSFLIEVLRQINNRVMGFGIVLRKVATVISVFGSDEKSVFEGFNLHILQTGIANFTGTF